MVRAQHDLLMKGLGLSHVVAIGGPSMGAQQGLEWGIHYPEFMDGLLLIVARLAKRPARSGNLRRGRGGNQARPEVPGRQLYRPAA